MANHLINRKDKFKKWEVALIRNKITIGARTQIFVINGLLTLCGIAPAHM